MTVWERSRGRSNELCHDERMDLTLSMCGKTLTWNYLYSDKQARAVAVDSRAILEALKNIYEVPALVTELTGRTERVGK